MEPKGFPSKGDSGMTDPLLPRLPLRKRGPAAGAKRWGDSRASRGGAEWWQASSGESSSSTEAGTGVWSSLQRLPTLCIVPQRAAPNWAGRRSLLPSPLILDGKPQTLASLRPGSGECEDSWRGSAREAQDSLGAHLGEFLPSRFQKFLHQLGAVCVQQPQPPSEALLRSPGGRLRHGGQRRRSHHLAQMILLVEYLAESWQPPFEGRFTIASVVRMRKLRPKGI